MFILFHKHFCGVSYLWQVMWVGHFSCHVKSEVFVIVNI